MRQDTIQATTTAFESTVKISLVVGEHDELLVPLQERLQQLPDVELHGLALDSGGFGWIRLDSVGFDLVSFGWARFDVVVCLVQKHAIDSIQVRHNTNSGSPHLDLGRLVPQRHHRRPIAHAASTRS